MTVTGRPSLYTPELAARICEELASGQSLRSICERNDMPASSTVFLWLSKLPEFSEQYARAREAQANVMAEEILSIADGSSNEAIPKAKLQVDTRKWLMSKMAPKKYGEKITQEQTGADGGPIVNKHIVERRFVHVNKTDSNRDGSGI